MSNINKKVINLSAILYKMKKEKNGRYKFITDDGHIIIEMDELVYKLLIGTINNDKVLEMNR